jgi:hypothetical protein
MLNTPIDHMEQYLQGGEAGKRPCFSLDVYMVKLRELQTLYGVKRVYLATDSEEMLMRIHSEPDFHWTYFNISRELFSRKHFHGFIDFASSYFNEFVTFSTVADLALLRRGDIFLGGFASHFSKVAYYAMAGSQMRIPAFISLDFPLSCDTVDFCTDEFVRSKYVDLDTMINRVAECMRRNAGGVSWGPKEREDPCGIYTTPP